MRGTRTPKTGLPRNPAAYQACCDEKIAPLRIELATATGPDAWERRREIQRRIDGYALTGSIFQDMAQ